MQETTLRVLLVEDNLSDQRLIQHALRKAGYEPIIDCVDCEADFRSSLQREVDVVLCDWALPTFDALRALDVAMAIRPQVPFIIVSGSIGEEAAVQAIKRGATDYLLKDRLGRLGPSIQQSIEQRELKSAEQRAREALLASEKQYRMLAESMPQIVWTAKSDGAVDYVNLRSLEYSGGTTEELIGDGWYKFVHPADYPTAQQRWTEALKTGVPQDFEARFRRADGEYRWHVARQVDVRNEAGEIIRWFGTCTDIHDQHLANERLASDAMLLASVRDSVIVTDLQGIVTYWNEGATKLFGWTAEEMLGNPYVSRFPVSQRSMVQEQIKERIRGSVWYGEYEDLRKDGSRVWIHSRMSAFSDANDQVIGILCVAYDITDLKRAEHSLSSIMHSVSDAIITVNAQGIIGSANPAVERIFGYRANELVGTDFQSLVITATCIQPAHVNEHVLLNHLLKSPHSSLEMQCLKKSGSVFWAELVVTEFELEGVRNFTCVIRDVSERKRLEEQFRQAQKMEAVGRLAGGVAHDFNNLLTVINSYSELLLAESLPNSLHHNAISAVRDAGERAARLTSQLLAYSRKAIVEATPLDLNEFILQYEELLRRLIGEDVLLSVKLAPRLGRIKADRSQLDQVVMNLIVNARDAMPNGGKLMLETREVIIGQESPHSGQLLTSNFAELVVTDTGYGMTEETLKSIFEPFFTTKDAGKGTGLGLAVVDGIVKQAGGNIKVQSELNVGTTFLIRFPIVEQTVNQSSTQADSPQQSGSWTIMLVEDDDAVRRISCLALEHHGYNVIEVANAKEAIERIANTGLNFDLLVTDVVMPEMSGRELAEILRADYPDLKVLYVSGYTEDRVVRHGVRDSAEFFLQKPFTPSTLAKKIVSVLSQNV
jgi:two-component system, cell cycle sensor histidine kinase and response regulator CckA